MSRNAIIISLLAMFLSGAALGLMGGIYFSHRMHAKAMGLPDPPHGGMFLGRPFAGPGGGPGGPRGPGRRGMRDPIEDVLPRLTRMLELSPEQVERIAPKVSATRGQFAAVRESLHARIESELTPEQIKRWREMRERMDHPGRPRGPWRRTNGATPQNEGEAR